MSGGVNWSEEELREHYRRSTMTLPEARSAAMGVLRGTEERLKAERAEKTKFGVRRDPATRTWDGIVFHSAREMRVYRSLKALADAGDVSDLKLQPVFVLQEGFTKGKRKFRPITYHADFSYVKDGKRHIVDAKGCQTEAYRIKKKLFEARFAELSIEEI